MIITLFQRKRLQMFKFLERLEGVVTENKQEIAYRVVGDAITYQELWEKANYLADSLKGEGNSPIIIYGHKSVEMILAIVACLIANRTYIPVDTYIPQERIKKIIQLSHATLMICVDNIFISGIECRTIQQINECFHAKEKWDTSINNIAYIIFTSGSTGEPKGVPISYENLDNFVTWIGKMIPCIIENEFNVLNQASFSFDLSVADLYFSLSKGCTLVGLLKEEQKEYENIFDILKKDRINLMVITPTFIKLLLLNQEFDEIKYPQLQCIYFCGEPLEVVTAQKLKKRFPHLIVINAYGPTEATSAVSGIVIDDEMLMKDYLPVGRISEAAVDISIVNEEIILKGKSVFAGYLNETSDNCFQEGGINCYKTGDIGKIENDFLYCMGRKDSQIKYMGYRIELGEIENSLLKIEEIREAVVVAKKDEKTNIVKGIKAFITTTKEISPEYIKEELSKILPVYMIPRTIKILEKMPVNDNGKYDRKKLNRL